jgi:para-aminobenzoate synthetase component 1
VIEALPIVREIMPPLDAAEAFRRLAPLPHCVFFDSARRDRTLGRYSFLAADPFDYFEVPADGSDGLETLRAKLAPYQGVRRDELPPFQGGAAGLFSYDLGRSLERVPRPTYDEFLMPAMAVGLYDIVLAMDHAADRAWIISQGFPERDPMRRSQRAERRLEQFSKVLAHSPSVQPSTAGEDTPLGIRAPQCPIATFPGLWSNFSREAYLAAVMRAIEYIRAGDIFQVNLAQRLLFRANDPSQSLYLRLRERNPATFAGYFDLDRFQICSASPERFVSAIQGNVETRPIKGTRGRTFRPEADLFAGDELQASEKDLAENVMIVDLLRNDLSRVCLADTVRVTQLCQLELYEYVQHLVSVVCGKLRPGISAIDLLRAVFPGGSITGAPKIRAQQIIAELEQVARGAYCGSLGYLGFDGTLDTNILIRTITAGGGWWQFPVGGGIVAQSLPEREYQETWHKAEGLLRALR